MGSSTSDRRRSSIGVSSVVSQYSSIDRTTCIGPCSALTLHPTIHTLTHAVHCGFADETCPVKLLYQLTTSSLSMDRWIVREWLYFVTSRMEYRTKTSLPDVQDAGSALPKKVACHAAFVMYKGSSALQRTRMANSGCEVWECFSKRAGSEREAIL